MNKDSDIIKIFEQSLQVIKESKILTKQIQKAVFLISNCLDKGNKVLIFGNGGSAADAQHMAAEFIGRYKLKRKSLPAIALTADTSVITAISNDYGFEEVFARQCESLVQKGDIIFAISTSGKSKNVLVGIKIAREKGAKIIALSGKNVKQFKLLSDLIISIPSNDTPRIQEGHRIVIHIICELVEKHFTK